MNPDASPAPRLTRRCTFPDCLNAHRAHGLCSSHLDQLARGRSLTPLLGKHGRKYEGCTFPDCDREHAANGLCAGHKAQAQRGQPLRSLRQRRNGRAPIGGEYITQRGYVLVKLPDHPNAASNGWVRKNVLVMSAMLGRPLRPGEEVHHKNLIRWDNDPSNLELWTKHQPTGARVADMAAWCRRFLSEYGEAFPEE